MWFLSVLHACTFGCIPLNLLFEAPFSLVPVYIKQEDWNNATIAGFFRYYGESGKSYLTSIWTGTSTPNFVVSSCNCGLGAEMPAQLHCMSFFNFADRGWSCPSDNCHVLFPRVEDGYLPPIKFNLHDQILQT